MTKTILTKFIEKGYSSYQIAKELNKSQSAVYRRLITYGLETKQIQVTKTERFCVTCQKKLYGKQTKFCSRNCNNDNEGKSKRNYDLMKKNGRQKRKELIQLKGGKCENCDYNKNTAVLCFHHKNPKEKLFCLNRCNQSWEKLLAEVKKCSLLCSNCHMELHHPNF